MGWWVVSHTCETDLAKVGTVVRPSPRTLRVAYYDDVMLTNRDGAFEDYGMSRTFEGECFGGHRRRRGHWRGTVRRRIGGR